MTKSDVNVFDNYKNEVHIIRCSDLLTMYANKATMVRWKQHIDCNLYTNSLRDLTVQVAITLCEQLETHNFNTVLSTTNEYVVNGLKVYEERTVWKIYYQDEHCYFITVAERVGIGELSKELEVKNAYLKMAAFMINHDLKVTLMTYFPLGLKGLRKAYETNNNLEVFLTFLERALSAGKKLYQGISEFINLLDSNSGLRLSLENTNIILDEFLRTTVYKNDVIVEKLPDLKMNKYLFVLLMQNLIKNSLTHNKSKAPKVKIYFKDDYLILEDNGIGVTQEEFNDYVANGSRKGLRIIDALITEHNWNLFIEKQKTGTLFKIKIND